MSPRNPPLILIADADSETTELVRFRLRRAGYRTATAADGPQALRVLGHDEPDLMLLDSGIPGLDTGAVARIAASAGNRAPALILLVSPTHAGEPAEVPELKVADRVMKPFSSPELLARIEVALRLRRRGQDGPAAATR